MSETQQVTPKRCAVYCRVSSDERLDQTFNSIDAQREAGAAFIASQRAEGWEQVEETTKTRVSPAAIWTAQASSAYCKTSRTAR